MLLSLFFSFVFSLSNNERKNYTFTASKKYIIFAIDEKEPDYSTNIYIDDQLIVNLNIKCAIDSISYFVPFELTKYENCILNVEVSVDEQSEFLKHLQLSDTYDLIYNETFRPGYHFTPKYGWMNDPNGMFYANGYWHLHYQYNPYAAVWGNMHWGHAVSKDLFSWEYLPFSLQPDQLGGIFSGSSIVDIDDVSGFGKNSIISFYTSAGTYQQQSLAYSQDNGWTWNKYNKNPIISNEKYPDFRDPKVIKYNSTHFVMCLAVGQHIEFWGSNNLIDWSFLSNFGDGFGNHNGVWECPDLLYFEDFDKYVLFVNINPGGYFGGSAAQYFVGSFNGTAFNCEQDPNIVKYIDYGKDAYAIVTFSGDPKGRRIALPWMSNWDYANSLPTKYFRSAMGIPREISLKKMNEDFILSSQPIEEIRNLHINNFSIQNISINQNNTNIEQDIYELAEIQIEYDTSNQNNLIMELFNNNNQSLLITINQQESLAIVDRTQSTKTSFSDSFLNETYCNISITNSYKFSIFIDRCSIEFFDGNGLCVMTNLIFPEEQFHSLAFRTNTGTSTINELNIFSLNQTMYNIDTFPPSQHDGTKNTRIIIFIVVSCFVTITFIIIVTIIIINRRKTNENWILITEKL